MNPPVETPAPHPSPNYSKRPVGLMGRISAIVLHTTESFQIGSPEDWFSRRASMVSAHVLIDTDGTIVREVTDALEAWHAGVSALNGAEEVNQFSLGVELVGHETQLSFPDAQVEATAQWCAAKCGQYGIDPDRIVAHSFVATPPGRKSDPGVGFNFPALRARVAALLAEG